MTNTEFVPNAAASQQARRQERSASNYLVPSTAPGASSQQVGQRVATKKFAANSRQQLNHIERGVSSMAKAEFASTLSPLFRVV